MLCLNEIKLSQKQKNDLFSHYLFPLLSEMFTFLENGLKSIGESCGIKNKVSGLIYFIVILILIIIDAIIIDTTFQPGTFGHHQVFG